jgi:hypothetical protein
MDWFKPIAHRGSADEWADRSNNMDLSASIHDFVATILAELGLPAPANIIQTMLMHDGYFVGWKFRYDGGFVVLHTNGNAIELYDEQGTPLKTVTLGTEQEAA